MIPTACGISLLGIGVWALSNRQVEILLPGLGLSPQLAEQTLFTAQLIGQQDGVDIHMFTEAEARAGFTAPTDAHVVFTCPPDTTAGITAAVAHGSQELFGNVRYWGYEYSGFEVQNMRDGKTGTDLFDGRFWLSTGESDASGGIFDYLDTPGLTLAAGKRYYLMLDGTTLGGQTLRVSCLDSDADSYNDAMEDLDSDGTVDPGETDPHDPQSYPGAGLGILTLTMDLTRDTVGTPSRVIVHVTATNQQGVPQPGLPVQITASAGSMSAVTEQGGGVYRATLTPAAANRPVAITGSVGEVSVQKTALVLGTVGAMWDQPEMIDGLVNTGWEDSAEVSPDGEWLIVATASPVSIFCCSQFAPLLNSFAGATPVCDINASAPFHPHTSDAACNASIGPVSAPSRPGFVGANRVTSPTTISHDIPSFGLTEQMLGGVPVPPVYSFGFRKQADGSYAEPFGIGYAMDGYTLAPFGFSFVSIANGIADLVYGFDEISDDVDDFADVLRVSVPMGAPFTIGTYQHGGGVTNLLNHLAAPLLVAPGAQGNPHMTATHLWTDDEVSTKDLYFSVRSGQTVGAPIKAGLSDPAKDESQPYMDGQKLYFTKHESATGIFSSQWNGSDPALAGSWAAAQAELLPGIFTDLNQDGAIIAIGEPTIARYSGRTWLYFIYIFRDGQTLNANVGRVRSR